MRIYAMLFKWIIWLINYLIINVKSLGLDCKCVVFDDTYGKEYGIFTSPNWPVPYEDNINCLLYNFIAKTDHIIEINFDEFDVQKTHLACVFGDYVKLYLHLSMPSINEKTSWNEVLCGKVADIDQTHYSSSYSLIFKFHSDWRNGNNTGFRGTYRFLNKLMYKIDGDLIANTKCDYIFTSESINNNKINNSNDSPTHGRFYSPQYPSTYPKLSKCSYLFIGKPEERVKIIFEHIQLQKGDSSCLNSPDVIYIHDGRNSSSPVIGQLCNMNTFIEFVSTSSYLFVSFLSKSHITGHGFKASFYFEDIQNYLGLIDISSIESQRSKIKTDEENFESDKNAYKCDQQFSSDVNASGVFSSPNFPGLYPQKVHCKYHFTGRGKQRVQIKFGNFSVFKPNDTSKDCEGADKLMVFITIKGQKERLDNLCGDILPQQLMSNGPSMIVEFKSTQNSLTSTGFQAAFKFITDFGITSGRQDSQSVCGFIFNSWESSNGTFASPNYPGLYPRDTECHYFFHGNNTQKVHITFAYFDVEGVAPCNTGTASDYVEFSNYKTIDRKIPRHCGLHKPKTIESDGNFFRITFKSNDRFDGTGFEAFYQFRNPEEDKFTIKQIRSLSIQSPREPTTIGIIVIWIYIMNFLDPV